MIDSYSRSQKRVFYHYVDRIREEPKIKVFSSCLTSFVISDYRKFYLIISVVDDKNPHWFASCFITEEDRALFHRDWTIKQKKSAKASLQGLLREVGKKSAESFKVGSSYSLKLVRAFTEKEYLFAYREAEIFS